MLFQILCLLFIFTFASGASARIDETVTIRLFETSRPHNIIISPPFQLTGESGSFRINVPVVVTLEKGLICLRTNTKNNDQSRKYPHNKILAALPKFSVQEIGTNGVDLLVSSTHAIQRHRRYHGIIKLSFAKDGTIDMINIVSRRDYVTGVVLSESPINAPYEMLRAQAVLVQTLLDSLKRNKIIGDSTQSQCYLGCSLENPAVKKAVSSVWRENLYYKNLPVTVYYHSTCAGGTSDGAKYFHLKNNNLPYLKAVPCTYCSSSPFWKPTTKEIPAPLFSAVFADGLPEITEKDYTGRPLSIKLSNGKTITGYDFWINLGQHFGWDKAPGTRFNLKAGKNGNIIIESTGAGHGVGLCQWGAVTLAKKGKSYKDILRYYFPGCVVH